MQISLDAPSIAGFVLAMTRTGAFVTASPVFQRSVPRSGRLVLVLGLSLFLVEPVGGSLTVARLLTATFVNIAVGLALGLVTGFVFHLFAVAGDLVDVQSGLANSAIFDPVTGHNSAVFTRLFSMTALVVFFAVGGDHLLVAGLVRSVEAIPLDGSLHVDDGLGNLVLPLTARIVVAGLELAMPALAALFIADAVLGVASRFAPQANVLVLGMPLKLLVTFSTVGIILLMFPPFTRGVMENMTELFTQVLNGLR